MAKMRMKEKQSFVDWPAAAARPLSGQGQGGDRVFKKKRKDFYLVLDRLQVGV
jgi:hypothetical protein